MEDDSSGDLNPAKHRKLNTHATGTFHLPENGGGHTEEDDEEEECDEEVCGSLNQGFSEVQSVLELNHQLIRQVDENQRSKIPENLAKNVHLINQINRNIFQVVTLYSNLSGGLTTVATNRAVELNENRWF